MMKNRGDGLERAGKGIYIKKEKEGNWDFQEGEDIEAS